MSVDISIAFLQYVVFYLSELLLICLRENIQKFINYRAKVGPLWI